MRNWNIFGAWTSHGHTQINKVHHDLNLRETTTFPLIILFVINHKGYIQMSSCPRTPKLGISKFLKLGLSWLWRTITSCANLWLRWSLKKSCSLHWELSKYMWHAICTQVNQGDSWLLVRGNQFGTLTSNPSFGHNLCFKYSNGSCKLILDIYVSRAF
jgi:hypothetical protein